MGQWSKLSAKEKAQIIKFAIDNGVSDINSIRDTYNVYADGGSIHIDKNKRGTFTAAATKHGKSVQEFARQVLANKENYSSAMVKKANFARNFGGHHHEDGGEIDTNNNRPQDQPQISWIENWLNSRKDVMAKNIAATLFNNYVPVYSPKNNTGDVRDAGYNVDHNYPRYNPLYWLLGQNPRIKYAEKIINREIQNIKNVPVTNVGNEYKPSYGMLGVYVMPSYFDNSGNYVAFLGIPKDEVKVHEFTHASHPEPQETYIRKVLYKDEDIPKSVPGNNKYIQSRELYAALQEVRYKSGLKPNVVVDEQWLKNNKKYFENTYLEGLPNNILIKLFNEVAQNSSSFKKSDNSYLAALGGGLKSTGGPLYPFSFQKNPYLKVPAVRYDEGGEIRNWDNTITGKLINYVENSDSIGWNPADRTWKHPILPGYDKNQIGMGVDKNETPGYWDYIQYRPETNIPFLTELDERLIRHNAIEAANKSANARYKFAQEAVDRPKGTVSPIKDAAVVSAIYNLGAGYVANGLFEDKDFMLKLFDGTDKEVVDRINQEYKKKNRNERIHKTDAFLFAK